MSTRIRAIRKLRCLTLQELADQVGTTPQTIQRLETGNMTVSVEWLTRIGNALNLPPAALLDGTPGVSLRLVGDLGSDGTVKPHEASTTPIVVSIPASDPMAIRVKSRLGPHEPGTILVVSRLERSERAKADGRDCLVELADGSLLFRRIVLGKGGPAAFVPYDDRRGVERNLDIVWFAPVVMSIRYLTDHKP
jgi:transcriptional regulator with XRE-family HTH domain